MVLSEVNEIRKELWDKVTLKADTSPEATAECNHDPSEHKASKKVVSKKLGDDE